MSFRVCDFQKLARIGGVWLLLAVGARAETRVLSPSSMDQIIGERQADGVATGYYASADNAPTFPVAGREGFLGVGGGTTTKVHGNVVLGFALPVLPAGHSIHDATLEVEVAVRSGTPPEIDVYGLGANDAGFAPVSSADTSLFLSANTDATQTKLVDNLVTPATTDGTAGNVLPKVFQADVRSFFDLLYSAGETPAGGREEVFFRLNTSAAISLGTISRYALTNDASRIRLTLVIEPGPPPPAPNLTVSATRLAATPALLGYNLGTFMPGANTPDWWRYSGVNAARMFLSPQNFPTMSTNNVANQSAFLAARTALRVDPLSSIWFNWPALEDRFANRDIGGFRVDHSVSTLRDLGVEMLMQVSASENQLPIADADDWGGKWRLWKHYYAMAYHLGRRFDVRRYQTFNEPDHPNAGGLTPANWLMRLQLASDAIRCAIADVNTRHGKALVPLLYAPTTANAAFNATWGGFALENRHVNFLGETNPDFLLFERYNYHQYGSAPADFGSRVAANRASVAAAMPGETPLPLAISEFNVNTGATFEATAETMDSPTKFSRFGAIAAQLARNRLDEMWVFKFTQTENSANASGVAKNGMHYADLNNFPLPQGGPTHGAEVWRLFVKGFASGRELVSFDTDGSLGGLTIIAGRDPATGRHYIFSANDSASATPLAIDVSAWPVWNGARVMLEEVGPGSFGAVAASGYTAIKNGRIPARTQPARSVWLYTIETSASAPDLVLGASDDAMVKDGANRNLTYGTSTRVLVKNDATNANARNAGLLRFALPARRPPDLQLALLEIEAGTITADATAQAFVYGVDDTAWSESSVRWSSVTNLRQNVAAGSLIRHNVVAGAGVNARIQGQLVASGPAPTTRRIDVTAYVRDRLAAGAASFLIAQENRWDVDIATGATGDVQADGLQIVSREGATEANPGPRLRLVFHLDSDGDGLSDQAELDEFGTEPDLSDTDGDGQTDGDEVAAGTAPLDPASWFRIAELRTVAGGREIAWLGVSGKTYTLERASNLSPADWRPIATVAGTDGPQTHLDATPPAERVFYRLRVR